MTQPDATKLYTAEALRIHELLDEQGIERRPDDGGLSLSQRVEELCRVLKGYRMAACALSRETGRFMQ